MVFDDEAIHVHHVESAVGASPRLDRPEPVIAGGEELGLLFILGTSPLEGETVRMKNEAVNQIVDRLAEKSVAVKTSPEPLIPISPQTAA